MLIVPPDIAHSIDALIPSLVDVVPSFVVVPVVNVTVPSAILTVPPLTRRRHMQDLRLILSRHR